MQSVAILCAQKNSVYDRMPGLDVFNAERDAFTFTGGKPVVAHPPCRLWSKLSHFVKSPDIREIELAMFCAEAVKKNGGVLEHPAYSRIFDAADLPKPGQSYHPHGFTLSVPQYWFGHAGIKDTWLFFSGICAMHVPEIPFRLIDQDKRPVEKLSRKQREATPPAFADWLIESARRVAGY